MPELPEVETIVRTLRPKVRGSVITGSTLLRASALAPQSLPLKKITGCRIDDVVRRGKLILFRLAPGEASPQHVIIHLRMTGALLPQMITAKPQAATRCVFDLRTPDGSERRLFFNDVRAFGQILIADDAMLAAWPFWAELGPEPLGMDNAAFAARLAGKKSAIKAVLLDQRVLAGIGNIYADESLFRAGISPRRKACDLTPPQRRRLLSAIHQTLTLAIAQCGTSVRNYRDANGDAGAFQNFLAVYGRGGQHCLICGRILEKMRVAGRGTVFCPNCQH